ncbi:MAG: sigma 54-interacting transcriptional regulator [Thermoanaerobaculia bacterium]|nr:sigma 54-interacting transcriptional regulator [Thermoanaerobaculia bacterium]
MSRERVETLRRFPLWATFSDELLDVVADAMEPITWKAGDEIIRSGEPGHHFSVMISGRADVRVRTESGNLTTVATMKEGDSFGEMSLLSDDLTCADVVATEDCETLALGKAAFHELISETPVLLREFVRLLSRRLKASDVAVGVARQKEEDLTRFLKEQKSEQYSALIGTAKSIKDLNRQVEAKSRLNTPLLIVGEKGSGKELVARLVHLNGPRKEAPLVSTDCGQITESQWGDQLFGLYDQGAAAYARGLSYLALADRGTILLNNVQALPPPIQDRLVRFLDGESLPTGARPDVRVIATCKANLLEEAAAGRFSSELAATLLGDVLEVPPLREHKRDIPDLASHFVKKHAQRLGRTPPAIEDQAMIRLVSYDYRFANMQELEESIERAVIITDGDTISADAIFLGLPRREDPRGFNLLSLPKPLLEVALRIFPGGIRAIAAMVFAFILYQCFAVEAGPWGNIGTALVWAVWWPALILSFFFVGRAWCAICPMAASGELTQRLIRPWNKVERRIPAWLKENDVGVVTAGFFLIVWVEEATNMRRSPVATGFLLLTIIAGAVMTSALFPRRAWCRHVCPMGGFAGLLSTSSLIELRPTQDICSAKCKGHTCYKGDAAVSGCPMSQHVMFIESNSDCVLCLNCVRLCPSGSPQLNVRIPARELWTGISARPQVAMLVVVLLGLLIGQAVIQFWESQSTPWTWARTLLEQHRFLSISVFLLISAAIPLGMLWLASRRFERDPRGVTSTLHWQRVTALAPLLGAGYAAYQFGIIPGLDRLRVTLGGLAVTALPDPLFTLRLLPLIQAVALGIGFAVTVTTLWKIWPAEMTGRGVRWIRGQAFSLSAATVYAAVLMLVMVMRPEWMPI